MQTESDINSNDTKLSDSGFDFIDIILGNGIRDTDINNDLDASDTDAAEENICQLTMCVCVWLCVWHNCH